MKALLVIIAITIMISLASAFDFTQAQVNYDAKGKAENIILEYDKITAVIYDIPQTKAKVKPEDQLIFTFGSSAPKKKPETLPGIAVVWLSCATDWTLDKSPSVTVTFPKDTTLDFNKIYSCYFLSEGTWVEMNGPRVDAKDCSISFWMKHLGTYAITYK